MTKSTTNSIELMNGSEFVNLSVLELLLNFLCFIQFPLVMFLLFLLVLWQSLALIEHLSNPHVFVGFHHFNEFLDHVDFFDSGRGFIKVDLLFDEIKLFHGFGNSVVVKHDLLIEYFFHILSSVRWVDLCFGGEIVMMLIGGMDLILLILVTCKSDFGIG